MFLTILVYVMFYLRTISDSRMFVVTILTWLIWNTSSVLWNLLVHRVATVHKSCQYKSHWIYYFTTVADWHFKLCTIAKRTVKIFPDLKRLIIVSFLYNVTRLGDFWKFLATKFLAKKPNEWQLFGDFEKPHSYEKLHWLLFRQLLEKIGLLFTSTSGHTLSLTSHTKSLVFWSKLLLI